MGFKLFSEVHIVKRVFLVDGVGGLATFVMAGFVLPRLPEHFPLPIPLLYGMSAYGFVCGAYSFGLAFFASRNFQSWIRGILTLNTSYLAVSLGVLIALRAELSALGMGYLVLEKIVILVLIGVEWRLLRRAT